MEAKYIKAIELDKVFAILSQYAVMDETKQLFATPVLFYDIDTVRHKLTETDEMTRMLYKKSNPSYSNVSESRAAVNRAQKGGLLSMGELLYVAAALRNARQLIDWFKGGEQIENETLEQLFYMLMPNVRLEQRIFEAILSPQEMADTASDELLSIRRKIRSTESSIRDKFDSLIRSQTQKKYLQDAVVTIRGGRFVVPVKAEFRGEVSGIVHDVSASGSTLFVEPAAVVEMNAKIMQLRNLEALEVERILYELSGEVEQMAHSFFAGYDAMLQIDEIIAKAKLAKLYTAIMPAVNSGAGFSLVKARHPLIAKEKVVPIDISLGGQFSALIITGPNTGGKTVTLKTAGLLCAMAQCGLLIPAAESSSVCVFDKILVDIGDEQSIEQSLSTFSGHIKNIVHILQQADENSLVLLDELGAGTDPAEGAALAVAIVEELRGRGAKLIATTHYAELKMYALETDGVQNAGCEFDVENLKPTYRLILGVPGRSNAFLIGQKLGLNEALIEKATKHMTNEDRRLEKVFGQLDDIKKELSDSKQLIEVLKREANDQLASAKERRDEIIAQGERELAAARAKAEMLVQNVQNSAYAVVDELKALQKSDRTSTAEKLQRAKAIAKRDAGAIYEGEQGGQNYAPLAAVKLGQRVIIARLGNAATVTALPDEQGNLEVLAGIIKTRVNLKDIYEPLVQEQQKPKAHKSAAPGGAKAAPVRHEINLIGKNAEEAVFEADKFIDEAVMANIGTVYLIHGRGTGTLRSAIAKFVKSDRRVKSYRLGRYGEGEDGVTVVELK